MTQLHIAQWWRSRRREREVGDEDVIHMVNTSWYENSGVRVAWLGVEALVSVFLPARYGVVPAIVGMLNWLAHEIHLSSS